MMLLLVSLAFAIWYFYIRKECIHEYKWDRGVMDMKCVKCGKLMP